MVSDRLVRLRLLSPIEHDTSEQLMTQTDEANPSLLLKP